MYRTKGLLPIAAKFGIGHDIVRKILVEEGVTIRRVGESADGLYSYNDWDRIKRMAEMRDAGMTLQEVGDEFKITRERVRQLLNKGGYVAGERGVPQRFKDAVAEYQEKLDDHRIYAARLGISQNTFRTLVKRLGGKMVRYDHGEVMAKARAVAAMWEELGGERGSAEKIREAFGLPHHERVYWYLRKAGVKPAGAYIRAQRDARREARLPEVAKLWHKGKTYKEMCALLKVTPTTIYNDLVRLGFREPYAKRASRSR